MKKILSFFAAMLCAVAVFADPVVLPATLDVSNVSFRSEGMPDFVLAEGDYAGTYFDMGAHDSANDTLLYAEWDVTIEPIKYDIDVVVYNTNSWRVQLYLLNQAGDTVKDLRYKGSSGQCGKYAIGSMDLKDLEAGNYKLRARAATAWSAMKLKELIVKADYKGATVELPGKLLPAYAELSANASISNDAIAFKPSTAPNEYATWNVNFAKAGSFDVSIDFTASNGHTYGVTLLSADGQTEIGAVAEAQSWDTGVKELGAITVPAAGKYIVKLTNATQWSEAVLNSITFAAPAPAHTYTVAGNLASVFGESWNPEYAANDMELQNDGTYKWEKTELTLSAGVIEFKVCEDHAWTNCWPSQNYELNISEDGIYTITITFDPSSNNDVNAVATKTGSAEVDPTASIKGSWDGWAQEVVFTLAADKKSASGVVNITEATDYTFKVILNGGDWRSNGYTYHREYTGASGITGNADNMVLTADVAGEYTFTWTFETNALNITFPEAEEELTGVIYDWAGEVGTTILGASSVEVSTVKIHKNTDEFPAIKFGSSYVYADGKWLAIKPAKGGFKAGDILSVAAVFNNNDDTKYAQVDVYAADGATRLFRSEADKTINGRTSASDPIVQTYTLASDQDSLFLGRYGNTGMFVTLLKVERGGETPVVLDAPDAAPADPTLQGYQVKAVYSAKYSADCNFGEWGSGTQYKQEEFGKKYATTNLGYFGMDFTGMDCSEMEALHLDAWIAADASIRVVPIHGGTEVGVTVELKGQKWNSIDIDLSKFEGVTNWSNVYQIKIDNAANLTFWLNNVYFYTTQEKTVDLVDGYYLIGTMNGWDIHNLKATDKFAVNPENDKEYVLTTALAENDEFKVVAVANNALGTWFPAEAGNYKVDFAHAGENKAIYFRPDYEGGEGWHAGCIYVAENVNTNPYETWFAVGDTWNTETESYLEWDAENEKATVHIAIDKNGQWRAQAKYHGPIAEEGKWYRVALKMKANNAIQNVTVKYQDNKEMIYVNDIALENDVEFVFDQKGAGIADGNGLMVLDFGFAKAGDVIEIYDVVIEETEAPEPTLADGFYLIGRINGVDGWDVAALKAENKFAPNLENPSEFMLNVTLAENDEIQVVNILNDVITAWYPGGEGNNYVVDANHAGAKTIYFRPDNQGGEDWWHGCIYVAPNHGTGFENTNAAVKAVKIIENGQLYIILNGVRYNALGQME